MNRKLTFFTGLMAFWLFSACPSSPPWQGSHQDMLPNRPCYRSSSDHEVWLSQISEGHPCRLVWEAQGFRPQTLP